MSKANSNVQCLTLSFDNVDFVVEKEKKVEKMQLTLAEEEKQNEEKEE